MNNAKTTSLHAKTSRQGKQESQDIANKLQLTFNWSLESGLNPLKQLSFNYHRLKYKNRSVPKHAWPKPRVFRDKTANNLQDSIVAFFYLQEGYAERINSTGAFLPSKRGEGRMVYGSSMNGTADLHGLFRGVSFRVEVKIGNDSMSDDQLKYKKLIEKCGGVYLIAKSFDGFIHEFFKVVEGLRHER